MDFEWDKEKAVANRKKHGVDFADAVAIFYDEMAITIRDDCQFEERFITVGMDFWGESLLRCIHGVAIE